MLRTERCNRCHGFFFFRTQAHSSAVMIASPPVPTSTNSACS
ncbi:hypothetical protein FHT10_000403 [Xanthomonas arboricola]|nr:hypothetical protein [Xanthomonas cannabis]